MKRVKRDITVLSFDDKIDYDEYKKFEQERGLFIKRGFDYKAVNYKDVLKGKVPKIRTKRVIIFLFFPFDFWNRNIEHRRYQGIYGNHIFYEKFMHFWSEIDGAIKKLFSNKEILIINNPLLSAKYRDKLLIKRKLSKAGVPNPRLHQTTRARDIYNLLDKGSSLYLKPRYGSMGKGITYLSPLNWQTNFIFKDNRIISRRSDYGWRFRDITGNSAFLSRLIKKDILIEEAIDSLILKRRRVDLRVYTFLKKAMYIYPKTNYPEKITTNISQGGRGAPHILKFISKRLVAKAKRAAINTARVLNLDLAGIDILLDRRHKDVYIVDVNVFPGLPKRKTFNLARAVIKELARLDNEGNLRFKKP